MTIELWKQVVGQDNVYMGINPKGELVVIFVDRKTELKVGRRVSSIYVCNSPECTGICVSVNLEEGFIDNPDDI